MLSFSQFKNENKKINHGRGFIDKISESEEDDLDLKWDDRYSDSPNNVGVAGFLDFLKRKKQEVVSGKEPVKSGIDLIGDLLFGKKNQSSQDQESPELQKSLSPVSGSVEVSGSAKSKEREIKTVLEALERNGIVNPFVQKAILSVIGKESGFVPQNEVSYENTDSSRIRRIFGDRFKNYTDQQIDEIKKDPNQFWEIVYGKRYGNDSPGDGAKYRGRGFNGLTFKGNYEKYNDLLRKAGIGADIVRNPDLLNKIDVAAEVNALYFLNGLSSKHSKRKYGNQDPNDFKDFDTALKAVTNANAGWGKTIEGSDALKKAQAYASNFEVGDSGQIGIA